MEWLIPIILVVTGQLILGLAVTCVLIFMEQ